MKIKLLIITILSALSAHAQQLLTDRDWYLAGEQLTVAAEVSALEQESKVAYIELCDSTGIQAVGSMWLADGRGQATLSLPQSLHSGNYLLSVYTRAGKSLAQKVIPVVNTLYRSQDDNIEWREAAGTAHSTVISSTALPESTATSDLRGPASERDGHQVFVRVHRSEGNREYLPSQIETSLAVVGKSVHVFDGNLINDSTAVFNTFDVSGQHPIVISANTYDGKILPVELLSPYAAIVPKSMPRLVFSYNRQEVEQRSVAMQRAAAETQQQDTLVFLDIIMGTKPSFAYNLDEYRQFRTIREVITEYIILVHHRTYNGHEALYVFNEKEGYSNWPALTLVDGMPVRDVEDVLKYDARRVNHILVYDGHYTFGNQMYKGIVNIVTRTGRLTNFPIAKGSLYIEYSFPQH